MPYMDPSWEMLFLVSIDRFRGKIAQPWLIFVR